MAFLKRLSEILRQDFGALIPGSGVAFRWTLLVRLFLYAAFFVFVLRLFQSSIHDIPRPQEEKPAEEGTHRI